ncbi:MAG: holo-ACP synthase [Burkholderiales bacterium]
MIIGIGTDLCDIERIQASLARFGERFARRVLMESELVRFQKHAKPAGYLAKRFAAKEAFSKAMGTGIRAPVNWHNIAVANARSGAPYFVLSEPLQALVNSRGIQRIHLSLTDERAMASAVVIFEGAAKHD